MYDYDPIGNRQSYTEGAAPPTTYTTNNVNKYPSTADPAESFLYDKDGNLIEDGDLLYSWDFENRLESVVPKSPGPGDVLLMFEYDYEMRRVRKVAYPWHDALGDWSTTPSRDIRFVYDGWNLLLELDGRDLTDGSGGGPDGQPDNTVIRKYTWGLDLSGTLQAAGGIGGLLAVEDANATPMNPADDLRYLYLYDANGNVGQLTDLTDGSVDAKYEYDPYGNAMSDPADAGTSGPYADANPIRFSTKYVDEAASHIDYGYRRLVANPGRWLSRDPLQEADGPNVYLFAHNAPILHVDPIGLKTGKGKYADCGCVGWKVVKISSSILYGANDTLSEDTKLASDIYEQCCVWIFGGGRKIVWNQQLTESIIGKDLTLALHAFKAPPTKEEKALTSEQSVTDNFLYVYYVKQLDFPAIGASYSFSQISRPPAPAAVVATRSALPRYRQVLAHEMGHVLLDGVDHHSDPANLMARGDVNAGKGLLEESQCDKIRKSPLVR
jgi:RHS repeat-associated protein